MKRITRLLSLLLVLALLGGCSSGHGRLDPGKEADKAVQKVLDRLTDLTDQTRDMTDEELAETIQGIAGEYRLTLNEEQMKFLISACRGLEAAEDAGRTAQSVGQAAKDISDGVGKVIDTVTGLLD